MKKCFSKILLPLFACYPIGDALGGASEPVRLFVKEVPLKVLGKEVPVIAIEQPMAPRDTLQRKAMDFTWKL